MGFLAKNQLCHIGSEKDADDIGNNPDKWIDNIQGIKWNHESSNPYIFDSKT